MRGVTSTTTSGASKRPRSGPAARRRGRCDGCRRVSRPTTPSAAAGAGSGPSCTGSSTATASPSRSGSRRGRRTSRGTSSRCWRRCGWPRRARSGPRRSPSLSLRKLGRRDTRITPELLRPGEQNVRVTSSCVDSKLAAHGTGPTLAVAACQPVAKVEPGSDRGPRNENHGTGANECDSRSHLFPRNLIGAAPPGPLSW
jgi:hypothetical protein